MNRCIVRELRLQLNLRLMNTEEEEVPLVEQVAFHGGLPGRSPSLLLWGLSSWRAQTCTVRQAVLIPTFFTLVKAPGPIQRILN